MKSKEIIDILTKEVQREISTFEDLYLKSISVQSDGAEVAFRIAIHEMISLHAFIKELTKLVED